MKHKPLLISGLTLYNRAFDHLEGDELDSIDRSALYLVRWPNHVLNPQFNGDCDYSAEPASDYKALDDINGIDIHADPDTWKMLPWFSVEVLRELCNEQI